MTGSGQSTCSRITQALLSLLGEARPARLGVAVSGGSDSLAVLHGLARGLSGARVSLFVATVDHGLRPEAADEAKSVAAIAHELGLPHETLRWQGWDGKGNLQDRARRARYRLLAEWARDTRLDAVALGHTADDQAETVLMRLGRSAGVDGLSGMAARRVVHGVPFLRPALALPRSDLRAYLQTQGLGWVEDPSNDDPAFDRTRARAALAALAELGVTRDALTGVAANMAMAREALEWAASEAARRQAVILGGAVRLEWADLAGSPEEIRRRLVLRAMRWVTGAGYPPRGPALTGALAQIGAGRGATLGGARLIPRGERLWIGREYRAVSGTVSTPGARWDDRWRLSGPDRPAEIRALGQAGARSCAGWRDLALPHALAIAMPAVWRNEELLAAPLAGWPNGWRAVAEPGQEVFFGPPLPD